MAIWLKAALAAPLLLSAAPAQHGPIYDGSPPARFTSDGKVLVSFGTLEKCGKAPKGYRFAGCVRGKVIHMPNPCNHLNEGEFAVIMCHELAHKANGWSGNHEL